MRPLRAKARLGDPRDLVVEFWDLVNRQDWRGLNSRVHHSGNYSPMEDLSLDIRNYK